MKISIIYGGKRAHNAADIIKNAMYDIHGTEVRAFSADDTDELYIQGGDAVVLVDEGDLAKTREWLQSCAPALGLNSHIGAVMALDGGETELLELLGQVGPDISAGLAKSSDDRAALEQFGLEAARRTAQFVGQWSLDFD